MGAAFLSAFERKQEYLLCVDSDGTVLDTMAQIGRSRRFRFAPYGEERWRLYVQQLSKKMPGGDSNGCFSA